MSYSGAYDLLKGLQRSFGLTAAWEGEEPVGFTQSGALQESAGLTSWFEIMYAVETYSHCSSFLFTQQAWESFRWVGTMGYFFFPLSLGLAPYL